MTWMTVKPTRNAVANDFDRMFNQFFSSDQLASCHPSGNASWPAATQWPVATQWPAIDVSETDDEIKLTLEAAGANKEDIKVTIKEGVLTISGKRTFETDEQSGQQIVSEIRSGEFSRSFTLPETVDTDKIKADFQNGLLQVQLAKLEEIKPKEIEVSVA